jgi:flagellar basal-body rod protein FlgG
MATHINCYFIKRFSLPMSLILTCCLAGQAKEPTEPPKDSSVERTNLDSGDALNILTLAVKNLKTAQVVIANNIANADTPGFKKSKVILADNGYRHEILPGTQDCAGQYTPTGVSVGSGSRVAAIQLECRQGRLIQTGGELDLAIEGHGFFQVQNPSDNTTCYTRAGKLSKNSNGQLVVCSAGTGRLMEPPIQIPQDATSVVITSEGQVSVGQPGNPLLQIVGQIQLATFVNSEGLLKVGENLYRENDSSGPPTMSNPGQNNTGVLRQGFIESSNVDLDEEIHELKRIGRMCRKIKLLIDE